jgi:3-isopropylmalate/(R)-2-methylmalate dehydratase small subunit
LRVWRLPADVDTDQLAPGTTMQHGIDVTARHCLEAIRPEFAAAVRPGDVLVAGPHFGIGSSREQAAGVLVHLGVAAVIAPSYSGLYFRNAFNLGLLLLTCADAELIADGETIAFDARAGRVTRADGRTLRCEPIPGFLLDRVDAGGLLPQLKRHLPNRPETRHEPARPPEGVHAEVRSTKGQQ